MRATGLEGPLPLTAATVSQWLNGPVTGTGARVTPEGSLQLTAVWSCVDLVSMDVARTPLPVYERVAGGRETADTHPLYRLLHDRPNDLMSAFAFKQTLQAHRMLRGNAFAHIDRDRAGTIIALWPLHPDKMDKPVLSVSGRLLYTYHLPNGQPRALTQDEVLHLRGLSPDGIWGYSPIQMHRESIGLGMAQRDYGAKFYGNNSVPGGGLQKKEGTLTDESVARLRQQWESLHRGLENAHKVAILEDGLEWKSIGISHRDAQYLEGMKYSRIEIAAGIFHVPPHKIGEMDRATFSNIEEQDIDYQGGTLDAQFALWESEINASLLRPQEVARFYAEFNRNALVRAKLLERMEAYDKAWWMTPNEKRARENMNAMAGLDEIFVPVNNVLPLSKIPEPVAPGAQVAP